MRTYVRVARFPRSTLLYFYTIHGVSIWVDHCQSLYPVEPSCRQMYSAEVSYILLLQLRIYPCVSLIAREPTDPVGLKEEIPVKYQGLGVGYLNWHHLTKKR